jgi:hypothetical protein
MEEPELPQDTPAKYGEFKNGEPSYKFDDLRRRADGKIVVKVRPDVLENDEAILAYFGHEMKELEELREIFAKNGGSLSAQRLHGLIGHPDGSIHQEAAGYGDEQVLKIRAWKAAQNPGGKP